MFSKNFPTSTFILSYTSLRYTRVACPSMMRTLSYIPKNDARIPLWRCPNQPNKQIQAPPPTALIKSWAIELFSNNDEPRTSIMSWFFRWYQAQGQRALASWPHPEEVMTLCVTQADQGRTSDLWSHTSFSDKEHKIGSSSSISRQKSLKSRNKTWPWIRNLFPIYFIYFWQFLRECLTWSWTWCIFFNAIFRVFNILWFCSVFLLAV